MSRAVTSAACFKRWSVSWMKWIQIWLTHAGEANKRGLQLKAVIWWKLFIVSLNFKHVLFTEILKCDFGYTHVRREQLSNVRLLFCTIKTQLNIHFTKVWYRFSESRKFKKVPEMQILCWWKLLWPRRAQTSAQLNTDNNPTWFFSPSLQTPGAQNDPKWTAAAERAPPAPPRCIQLT